MRYYPSVNIINLLLADEVIDAVRAGQFQIYAVDHVDQALVLLSGEEAGCADQNNVFPEGSINARVVERLRSIAELDMDSDESKSADSSSVTP